MRLRNRPWAAPELSACPFYINHCEELKGHWKERFGNENPICLELGCGKGLFLKGIAPKSTNINFIGADVKSLMLAYARRNIQEAFEKINKPITNVLLLSVDAERIYNAFCSDDKISRLILNFSNPWPKPKHHKKRLTHPKQLENYKEFLENEALIEFKTDNDEYYLDTIDYLNSCGFTIIEQFYDYYELHEIDEALLTEHEAKFISQGLPIHYLKANLFK